MNNPPAFPRPLSQWSSDQEGMTLLDYFAAAAMQGLIACGPTGKGWLVEASEEWVSRFCYRYADAMLKAREQ